MPLGLSAAIFSGARSKGWISQYTLASRTRRAISWVYWLPKSRIRIMTSHPPRAQSYSYNHFRAPPRGRSASTSAASSLLRLPGGGFGARGSSFARGLDAGGRSAAGTAKHHAQRRSAQVESGAETIFQKAHVMDRNIALEVGKK